MIKMRVCRITIVDKMLIKPFVVCDWSIILFAIFPKNTEKIRQNICLEHLCVEKVPRFMTTKTNNRNKIFFSVCLFMIFYERQRAQTFIVYFISCIWGHVSVFVFFFFYKGLLCGIVILLD